MNLVLTGSSSGIGRSLAARLLADGHRVVGIARSPQDAAALPGLFHPVRCDVSDWAAIEAAAGAVGREMPSVDGLVTCAGVHGEVGRAMAVDPRRWSDTVRMNLDGTYFAIRAFHPLLMRAKSRPKVICFSGGGATKSRPNFSAYGAAKTAILRLVETLAEEERGQRLDVNAVAPGSINTRLTDEILALGPDKAGADEYALALKQKASGGASMEKVAGLVEWLLSPASDRISGRLFAAPWDNWAALTGKSAVLEKSDVYQLRRILPEERGLKL